MRSKFNRISLLIIALLTVASIVIIWPDEPDRYFGSAIPWPRGKGLTIGDFSRRAMRLGLHLRGRTRIVLQADTSQLSDDDLKNLDQSLNTAVSIIEKRVNNLGVAESEVSRQGSNRIVTELPGISPDEARSLVGKTASLEFKEVALDTSG